MTLQEQFLEMQRDPVFARLSYQEQVEVRMKLLSSGLPGDPDFMALPSEEKDKVLRKLSYAPPMFENPRIGKPWTDLASAAIKEKESGIKPPSPKGSAVTYALAIIGQESRKEQLSLLPMLQDRVVKPIARAVAKAVGIPVIDPIEELAMGRDRRKGLQYLDYTMSETLQMKNNVSIIKAMWGIVGFGQDILTYYAATGLGAPSKLVATGVQALGKAIPVIKGAEILSRGVKVGLEVASKFVPQATGEGIVGVIRENLLRAQRGQPTAFGKAKPAEDMWKTFGEYALIDFAFGAVVQTATRSVSSIAKVLTVGYEHGGLVSSLKKAAPGSEELLKIMDKWMLGEHVDDAALQRLPEIQREHLLNAKFVQEALRSKGYEASVDPVVRTRLASFNLTLVPTIVEDGTWVFRELYPGPKGFKPVVRNGITAANTYLADTLQGRMRDMDDADILQWKAGKFWITPFTDLPLYVDDLLDTRKLVLDISKTKGGQWISGIKSGSYLSPIDRPVIDSTEAALISRTAGRDASFVALARYDIDPTVNQRIVEAMKNKGASIFDDSSPLILKTDPELAGNNALVILRNPATETQQLAAREIAKRQILEGKLPYSVEDLARYNLISSGLDGVVHADGSVEAFFPSRVRIIDDRLNPRTGRFSMEVTHGVSKGTGSLSTKAEVYLTLKGSLPVEAKVRAPAITSALGSEIYGKLNRDDLLEFAKTYYRSRGVDPEGFVLITDPKLKDSPRLTSPQGTGKLQILAIPERIDTPEDQRKFVRTFIDSLQVMADTRRANLKKISPAAFEKQIMKNLIGGQAARSYEKKFARFAAPVSGAKEQEEFLRFVVSGEKGEVTKTLPAGSLAISYPGPGGAPPVVNRYASIEEAVDKVLLQRTTERELEIALQERGLFLRRKGVSPSRILSVADSKGQAIEGWSGSTPGEVFEKAGFRPKIDGDRFGPQFVVLDSGARNFVYKGRIAYGGRKEIAQMLSQFHSVKAKALQKVVNVGDGSIARGASSTIEVYLPATGSRKSFPSVPEALGYVRGEWKQADNLVRIAKKKGFSLIMANGQYELFGENNVERVARNEQELFDIFKEYPDPEWAPSIEKAMGVPDSVVELLDSLKIGPTVGHDPSNILTPPEVKARAMSTSSLASMADLRQMMAPRRDYLDRMFKKLGKPDLAAQVLDVDAAHQLWRNDVGAGERILDKMHLYANGKRIPVDREIVLAGWVESKDALKGAYATEMKMTSEEVRIGEQAQDWFDGMFARAGLDSKTFLQVYLPRVRKTILKRGPADAQIHVMAEDLMTSIWGKGKVPNEVKWWAEYERTSDLVLDIFDRNLLSLQKRYLNAGLRKFYLDPTYRKIAHAVNAEDLPFEVSANLELWRRQLMGMDDSYAELLLKRGVDGLADGLKKSGEISAKDIAKFKQSGASAINRLYTLSYMASLGWRPWTAIRNMFQVFTHVATRFGIADTVEAVNKIADYSDARATQMRAKGIITDLPPQIDAILGRETRLGRAAGSSMSWLKNSDDFSRLVGWEVAEKKWNRGIAEYITRKGRQGVPFDIDGFLKYTDANLLGAGTQEKIRTLVAQNKMDAALDVFGRQIIDDTLFAYRQTQKPLAFRGIVGRAFGQFGLFAANHVQHLKKGLTRGTALQIAGFATREMAVGFGLYHAFRAIGIDEDDFLPWIPLSFSGGPASSFMLTAWKAVLGRGYEARQARGELDRYFPFNLATFTGNYASRLKDILEGAETPDTPGPSLLELVKSVHLPQGIIPGYFEAMSIVKAIDYAKKDDPYRAILSLGGVPLVPGE